MIKWLSEFVNRFRVDGSRVTIMNYDDDEAMTLIYTNSMCLGSYNHSTNYIEISEELMHEQDLELLCAVISHEFLHMLLEKEISIEASFSLDNICPVWDNAWVKNGGI